MAKVAPAEPQEQPELEAEPIPPRLRPGSSTVIEGVTVLTSEGPIEGAEHERLLDELLHGNGFFIAKGVLPEAVAAEAREKLLARGAALPPSSSKRLHNIIEDDAQCSRSWWPRRMSGSAACSAP